MLKIEDLHVYYGGIHALKGIGFEVKAGQIVTLIGANGAGKSTTLRAICGLLKPCRGRVTFEGTNITGWQTNAIVKGGTTMVPEGRKIFSNLTVQENLMAGAYQRSDQSDIQKDLEWIFSLFPRLQERLSQKGGALSGGEQQMLAIGRALMSRPRLLMFDEPSLGLAPVLVEEVFRIIRHIHSEGTTICWWSRMPSPH